MLRSPLTTLFLFSIVLTSIGALKILVISPTFGRSHMQFMGSLADLYVQNGHEVVYFEPEIIADEPILDFKSSKLARSVKKKKDWEGERVFAGFLEHGWTQDHNSFWNGIQAFTSFIAALGKSCRSILNDEVLLTKLRDEKFDLGIAEVIGICPYALYRKIGIKKYISASATPVGSGFSSMFGIAAIPTVAYIPDFFTLPYDRGTFLFRLFNLANFAGGDIVFRRLFLGSIMKVINEYYPDMEMDTLMTNSSYVFINTNDHIEFVKPMPLKFVNVAGIGVPKVKPLPEDYQKFMDGAKNGVILVSFGSSSQSRAMPDSIRQAFLYAFDQFPQVKFLWKFENASVNVEKGHANVWSKEWIPQVDILNHKNTIGFISHGGMNSLIESSVSGVPTICIALFGDQARNCKMSEQRGISIRLDKEDVSKETLVVALRELINNKKYLKQAKNLQQMIKKAPMSPEERVLKYTEFAAEFDIAQNLDDESRKLSVIAFYNLDIFAFFIGVFIILSIVLFYVIRLFLKLVKRCLFGVKSGCGDTKKKSE